MINLELWNSSTETLPLWILVITETFIVDPPHYTLVYKGDDAPKTHTDIKYITWLKASIGSGAESSSSHLQI